MEATRHPGRAAVFLLGAGLVSAIGVLDYATGVEIRVFPLYFLPVSFVCWRLGRAAGISFAVLSAAMWQAANLLAGMDRTNVFVLAWNTGVQLTAFLAIALLMAELHGRLEREKELSRTDPLTALANVQSLRERLALEVERVRRWGRPLTVAYLDLDRFKEVNDRFGHAAGDRVLVMVADCLRTALRATDLAARVGGDEFVLVLPETDEEGARIVVDDACARLEKATASAGWPVSASAGLVTTASPADAHALLRRADTAMYAVKRARRAPLGPQQG